MLCVTYPYNNARECKQQQQHRGARRARAMRWDYAQLRKHFHICNEITANTKTKSRARRASPWRPRFTREKKHLRASPSTPRRPLVPHPHHQRHHHQSTQSNWRSVLACARSCARVWVRSGKSALHPPTLRVLCEWRCVSGFLCALSLDAPCAAHCRYVCSVYRVSSPL